MDEAPPLPVRLLICDDHRVLTDALVLVVERDEALSMVGPPVRSPDEAIDACREHRPDVVLMDISFEGEMDGVQATRLIKEACPDTNVVIMTAHHDELLMVEAVEAGASGYLSKTEGVEAVLEAAKAAARGEILIDAHTLARSMARVAREREARRDVRFLLDQLTDREGEILGLLTEGLRNDDIAARLFISPFTVQTHIGNILRKLRVRSRAEAVAFALRRGTA